MTRREPNEVKISIVMPVYNGGAYLRESIESLLNQTYGDFELLVVNDGSADESGSIIRSFRDSRIRLVEHERNQGIVASLNDGISLSRGIYIARMDQDDIALPGRLERQILFMEDHPGVGAVGSWVRTLGDPEERTLRYPSGPEEIRCRLFFENAMAHSTLFLRKRVIEESRLRYRDSYQGAEDYDLWVRISEMSRLENLQEVLLLYRLHPGQMTRRSEFSPDRMADKVRAGQISKLGIIPTEEELDLHFKMCRQEYQATFDFVARAEKWFLKLTNANAGTGIYPVERFELECARRWFFICTGSSNLGLSVWSQYRRSSLKKFGSSSRFSQFKFALKCGLKAGGGEHVA